MGLRDTLKDLINGIREKNGNDRNRNDRKKNRNDIENSISKELARVEKAENREWIENLKGRVGGVSEENKSALKEKVKQTENVKTNNSPKKGQPKRMKGDREIGD